MTDVRQPVRSDPSSIDEYARALMARRQTAGSPALQAEDLDLAYAIQDHAWQLGRKVPGGYKIGLTDLKAQAATNMSSPIAGRVATTRLAQSPARLRVREAHLRIVEAELVFEIAHDLDGRGKSISPQDVFDATRAFYAGIEVCDTRLLNDDDASIAEIVADNANADWLVIGEQVAVRHLEDLGSIEVRLSGAGLTEIAGSTERVLGNPAIAIAWLANHLATRGERLPAGLMVASGSCTGMTEAPLGTTMRADFDGKASATVALVAEMAS